MALDGVYWKRKMGDSRRLFILVFWEKEGVSLYFETPSYV
jgi:hypothetical protein